MRIRFDIIRYVRVRRRQSILEQELSDQEIERIWTERVRNNWKERARLLSVPRAWLSPSEKPAMLRHQAE